MASANIELAKGKNVDFVQMLLNFLLLEFNSKKMYYASKKAFKELKENIKDDT